MKGVKIIEYNDAIGLAEIELKEEESKTFGGTKQGFRQASDDRKSELKSLIERLKNKRWERIKEIADL